MDSDEEIANLERLLMETEDCPSTSSVAAAPKSQPSLTLTNFIPESADDPPKLPNLSKSSAKALTSRNSAIHSGDTDSSDDEEVRNFLDRKYNEYGRDINLKLRQGEDEKHDAMFNFGTERRLALTNNHVKKPVEGEIVTLPPVKSVLAPRSSLPRIPPAPEINVYTDPIFGLRMVNPLISSTALVDRMQGKTPVTVSNVRFHTERGDCSKDWVIAGVLINKSAPRTSQKGALYSIWTLTDLKGEIKTFTLFLFKNAHSDLWKSSTGIVVGILNPGVLERKDEKVQAVLTIDNPQKVMLLGQSKDLGVCKSKKNNGQPCTATVNLNTCDYCIYHVKQEYGKASRRSEFGSSGLGRGLNELRNKVLGKSEIFYAGQSFSALPAKKTAKQIKADKDRLMTLSEYYQSPFSESDRVASQTNGGISEQSARAQKMIATAKKPGLAASLETNVSQRKKDFERLRLLQGLKDAENAGGSQATAVKSFSPSLSNLTANNSGTQPKLLQISSNSPAATSSRLAHSTSPATSKLFSNSPTLSAPSQREFSFAPKLSTSGLSISLNTPMGTLRRNEVAKQKAAAILQNKPQESVKKRGIELLEDDTIVNAAKKAKLKESDESARKRDFLIKMLNAKSSHQDLVEKHQDTEQEKYFNNLERKENMEEKMMNTKELACKAVTCLKCKYVAFSAAEICKKERHELKVHDAMKRFYKCGECGFRTITLQKIPKISCKNCQSSRWERCGMMNDKKGLNANEQLSIRGDEESNIGHVNRTNINLLVPENGDVEL